MHFFSPAVPVGVGLFVGFGVGFGGTRGCVRGRCGSGRVFDQIQDYSSVTACCRAGCVLLRCRFVRQGVAVRGPVCRAGLSQRPVVVCVIGLIWEDV